MSYIHAGICLVGIALADCTFAAAQDESKGFVEDSHLTVALRNAYISRDYKDGNQDKAEWGQGVMSYFTSGFTQGVVGVGVDAFALGAVRLDGGKGRSGAGGIDFFHKGDSGQAADTLSRTGGAVKFRVSNTVLTYGEQRPTLPVLSDSSRLLPETYTGTLIQSKEIEGLELTAGRFTGETQKSAQGRDSGGLKSINVYGARYSFTPGLSAALYGSDVESVLKKQYANILYVLPLSDERSVTVDFNGYRTRLDRSFAGGDDPLNTIWSLSATYQTGIHSFMIAHQRSNGDMGYPYGGYQSSGGIGDGGSTIFLTNSYWSDFNGKDERSWQFQYGVTVPQVPGLSFKVAYVRGDNIDDGTGRGRGDEHELFSQASYVVREGAAKDLSFRLRSSVLNVSDNASNYNREGREVRVFIDYPISVF